MCVITELSSPFVCFDFSSGRTRAFESLFGLFACEKCPKKEKLFQVRILQFMEILKYNKNL